MLVMNIQVTWLSVDPLCPAPAGQKAQLLQKASVKIINDTVCQVVTEGQVTSRMLCSGFLAGGVDACQVRHSAPLLQFSTSAPSVTPRLWSSGRLRRTPGVLRGEREVVPGRHRELGRGLCTAEQAGSLHARYRAEKMDQRSDGDLRKEGSAEWGETWACQNSGNGAFEFGSERACPQPLNGLEALSSVVKHHFPDILPLTNAHKPDQRLLPIF